MGTLPAQPLKREIEFVWFRASQRAGTDGTLHKFLFLVSLLPAIPASASWFQRYQHAALREGTVRHQSSIYFGWCQTGLCNIFVMFPTRSGPEAWVFPQCELVLQN